MRRLRTLLIAILLGPFLGSCVPQQQPPHPVRFGDEFNGTALDLSRWQPNWLAGNDTDVTKPINGAELSCYDPHNVSVSGSVLHLRLDHRGCTDNRGQQYSYASGLINSRPHFTFREGHVEARVLFAGQGTILNWPAFWTDGTGDWPTTGESDIVEGLAGRACWHYHSPSGSPGSCPQGDYTGWHTYGETVQGNTTTYFYDGRQVGQANSINADHFIIFNLATGTWGGPIAAPSKMLVDWVRVTD